jgi:hypothetical protein
MERCTFAYRLPHGAIRGFVGRGSSRRDAYHDCIRRVDVKLWPSGYDFDVGAIVCDITGLASGERSTVETDWHSQA